jgi:hypothetical protein
MFRGRFLAQRDKWEDKGRTGRTGGRRCQPPGRRLRLEPLEDRRMLNIGDLVHTLNPTFSPQPGSEFGYAVAADGNLTVVGAPGASLRIPFPQTLPGVGIAYVFNSTTGAVVATLRNPSPFGGEAFGSSVSISGNTVVVGAPYDEAGAWLGGSAYIFDATTGNLLRTLKDPAPVMDGHFGSSVAVSGTMVVVGEPQEFPGAPGPGAAYVFDAATGAFLRTLYNPTSEAGDQFGASVAVSGTTAVVGAPRDFPGPPGVGAAYVFDAATGGFLRTLNNPAPEAADQFGASVAVSGTTVLVGAPGDSSGGSVYVYAAATGTLLQTLNNPAPASDDLFGGSVAVSGNMVAVGAYGDDTGAMDAGSVYIFDAATDSLIRTLDNPAPASYDNFGRSVAISGGTVAVGGPNSAHSAYLFDAATGNLLRALADPTPPFPDYFGNSVAVSGNTLVVGAPYDSTVRKDAGLAYIFDAATGSLLRTLSNPTPADEEHFGWSVAISGSTVVVGAPSEGAGSTRAGSAYIFDAATGTLLWTLNNPTPANGDLFGASVGVSGSTVVVGAYHDDTGATDSGSVYVFDLATGTLLRTLSNPTPGANDYFGCSVALSGTMLAVGAYGDDTRGTNLGSVYLFDPDTGNLLRTLNEREHQMPPELGWYRIYTAGFGYSVALSGNTLVVGSPYDWYEVHFPNTGSVYVYDLASGTLLHILQDPNHWIQQFFGYSVAISDTTVVVGSPPSGGSPDPGWSFVFDAATGNRLAMLVNPTPVDGDGFGSSVAISGGRAVVGEPLDDELLVAVRHGTAYVFDASLPDLTPPSVISYTLAEDRETPNDQATTDRTPVLTFVFSEPVLGTAADVSVTDPSGAPVIPDAIGGWGTDTVLITFSTPLSETGQYTVTLHGTTTIADAAGNRLDGGADDVRHFAVTASPTVFTGTAGPDVLTFDASGGSIPGWHRLTLSHDGAMPTEYLYLATESPNISFNGLGGTDSFTITGGDGTDTANIGQTGKGTVKVVGTGYTVNGSNLETISVQAGAGTSQVAKLLDTAGNDVFTARYREATMTDAAASYSYTVSGFDLIYAYKTNLGTDEAHFYDSPQSDTFVVKPWASHGYMSGPGFWNFALGFTRYYGYSTAGGSDAAHLYDSKGDDVYKAWANRDAQMDTSTIDAWSYGFALNYGHSTAGGSDEARFYDSPGDDTFTVKAYAGQGFMTGPGFYNYASGFARYYGYSTAGGRDFSLLADSKGDDVYKAWANRDAQMDTATIDAWSYGFAFNYGYSTAGGANDVAYLYDSSGDDTFVVKPLYAYLTRQISSRPAAYAYWSYALGFDKVYAVSENGGANDQAFFYDTYRNDEFYGSGNIARLHDAALAAYFYEVQGFDRMNVFGTAGGTNHRTLLLPIDYALAFYGTWT